MKDRLLYLFIGISCLILAVWSCTYHSDCVAYQSGCCLYNKCQYNFDSYVDCWDYNGAHCNGDNSCKSGCCIDSLCEPETDARCIFKKNECDDNWDCDSSCCKNKQCQEDVSSCSEITTSRIKLSISRHQNMLTLMSIFKHVGSSTLDHGTDDWKDTYIPVIAASVCMVIVVLPFLIAVIYAQRRRRALLSSRCIAALLVVPIVEDDELQRENHRQNDDPTSANPPPAYQE